MKVVIADDEPLARERLRALLAEHPGIEVVAEAENGLDALQACSQHRPDMVLLDIAMPGVDGLEAARHLAAFDPRPAVVFCTAYDEHALSAFEAAAIDYLMKPIRPERLAAALDIPPLAPIPADHVLTRSFYLLQDFPGRYFGRDVWAEAPPAGAEAREGFDRGDSAGGRQVQVRRRGGVTAGSAAATQSSTARTTRPRSVPRRAVCSTVRLVNRERSPGPPGPERPPLDRVHLPVQGENSCCPASIMPG